MKMYFHSKCTSAEETVWKFLDIVGQANPRPNYDGYITQPATCGRPKLEVYSFVLWTNKKLENFPDRSK